MGRKKVAPALPLDHSKDPLRCLQPLQMPWVWLLKALKVSWELPVLVPNLIWTLYLLRDLSACLSFDTSICFSLEGRPLLPRRLNGWGWRRERTRGLLFHNTFILKRHLTLTRSWLSLPFFPQLHATTSGNDREELRPRPRKKLNSLKLGHTHLWHKPTKGKPRR